MPRATKTKECQSGSAMTMELHVRGFASIDMGPSDFGIEVQHSVSDAQRVVQRTSAGVMLGDVREFLNSGWEECRQVARGNVVVSLYRCDYAERSP